MSKAYFDMGFLPPRQSPSRRLRGALQQLRRDLRSLHVSRQRLAPLPNLNRRPLPR